MVFVSKKTEGTSPTITLSTPTEQEAQNIPLTAMKPLLSLTVLPLKTTNSFYLISTMKATKNPLPLPIPILTELWLERALWAKP